MVVTSLYPENVWVKVGKRASSVMGVTEAEFFTGVGTSFVQFVTSYGFDKLTGSIARNYRDFVQVKKPALKLVFLYLLLATLFPPTGTSASFPSRLASNDLSLVAKWACQLFTSNYCLSNTGKI